ncbi:hypothetical protein TraAM80_06094 [Trypanosoma rangeli]|uniref:L-type lectin-like domain-containing protein n=1 Tax=Trypanosoma rangeli TaxID=5698 RepID=A0A3R7LT82_TRYRA|nr:uncharacterized protein TraAM80_06094 [Trypanosoma rangeli]RNF02879.1 hypothetical protein TraAM80_06094 [Trypanosoma rangeli]|eukprot:RNF02879.1 hypothetical protein TraAM80_06094 [Trypanosoma rangeli]
MLLLMLLLVPCVQAGDTVPVGNDPQRSHRAEPRQEELPVGLIRSPLLHEHSFGAPIVTDWWHEGVPHFMIGGSAVANEKFIRLTTNSPGDHGFAFNTAPCDHRSWEARLRFSIRPPLPLVRARKRQQPHDENEVSYQGGEGMALWYLEQPLGDDHQHVPKYSKPLDPAAAEKEKLHRDPIRIADLLFNTPEDDEDDDDEDAEEANATVREKRRAERLLQQQSREAMYRHLLQRGTSTDNSNLEPRIFGLKFSEFKGFGVLLDSVGHREEADHQRHRGNNDNTGAAPHALHEPRVTLLFNLPAKERGGAKPPVNNFNPQEPDFRTSAVRLQCQYDFRQSPTERAVQMSAKTAQEEGQEDTKEALLRRTPEDPVELVVQYHRRRLTVMLTREDMSRRRLISASTGDTLPQTSQRGGTAYRIEKTHVTTLCGEFDNVELPLNYHFGVSASTGPQVKRHAKEKVGAGNPSFPDKGVIRTLLHEFYGVEATDMHVDVHDVIAFELRELGKDAKAMGYSKSIPIEHFDYDFDRRERLHLSRQLPVEPEPDE